MQTLTLTLPKLHTDQRRICAGARRFTVAACGRRYGKTTLFQDRAIRPALEGWPVGWFAPTYKLLLEAWRQIEATLWPVLRRANATDKRMELITGGVLEFWTLEDSDAGRSRKYRRVIIDEAGLVKMLLSIWHQAIRPTLADLSGDAWFGGTPKGRNDFWQLWEQAHHLDGWAAFRAPTEANPHIDPAEVAELRASLPATVAAQELDADFTEGELTLFTIADVERAAKQARGHQPRQPGRQYLTTVDVGRRRDATVINTFDTTEAPYQRVAFDRLERLSYPIIQQRITERVRAYPGRLVIESNGVGDPLIENLDVPAEPFVTTAKSKLQALQALQVLFEQGKLGAPWDARERQALISCSWDDDHTADEVMSLAIFAASVHNPLQSAMDYYARLAAEAATAKRDAA